MDFQVKRADLRQTRFVDEARTALDVGCARLKVDAFGFSANNVTYAVLGDLLAYWTFFPAPEGWGRIPVWGFADVVESRHPGLREGMRVFGYLPPSTQLLVAPDRAGVRGFVDASPHRLALPAAYNSYSSVEGDATYDDRSEDAYMLLRPVFFLSFTVDDFLLENGFLRAKRALISSASSKGALGLAFLLARRGNIAVVGLTSKQRVNELNQLGIYTQVVGYDDIGSLDSQASIYVDLSGSADIRAVVHQHLGSALKLSLAAGATHGRPATAQTELPGPKPVSFFAPDHIVKRTHDWGRTGFNERFAQAWHPFVAWTKPWLKIRHASGPAGIERAYREVLDGRVTVDIAHVLTPS
jgi:hypothetical protein